MEIHWEHSSKILAPIIFFPDSSRKDLKKYIFTSSTLVFQNNETAVMLVYHANPVGFELFSYVNISICFNKFVYVLAMWGKTLHNLKS